LMLLMRGSLGRHRWLYSMVIHLRSCSAFLAFAVAITVPHAKHPKHRRFFTGHYGEPESLPLEKTTVEACSCSRKKRNLQLSFAYYLISLEYNSVGRLKGYLNRALLAGDHNRITLHQNADIGSPSSLHNNLAGKLEGLDTPAVNMFYCIPLQIPLRLRTYL